MKIPAHLSKGLDANELEQLERELKSSILAKKLRKTVKGRIEALYKEEEYATTDSLNEYLKVLGERRGYREILNLIPEE